MFQLRLQLANAYTALRKWNLYRSSPPPENDDDGYQLKNQLISTRLFVCLLLISTIILLTYVSQVQVTHTVTIDSPSLQLYSSLSEKYAATLICPCTNIAIPQHQFISLTPVFHQICKSDFVEKHWLSYLNAASHYHISSDFQDTGSLMFQILASFCQLAQDTIKDSLPKLYSTTFVSYDVIDTELLKNQSRSLIDLYILTTANQFSYSFDFIRDAIAGNGFLSGIFTNFELFYANDSNYDGYRIIPKYKIYNQSYMCDCSITSSCVSQAVIHDNVTGKIIFVVPGLNTGCLLVEAMRQSNLQCLYNQTCLEQMKNYTRPSVHSDAKFLNSSVPSRYNVSTNISEILANLMVERWIDNISYSGYFNACQPVQCTYTKVGKNSVLYIVTTLFGLYGGLYKALYFFVPIVVKIIRYRRARNINLSVYQKLRDLTTKTLNYIRRLNLFPDSPPSVDQYCLITERISTFVYIILLIFSCLILLVYTATETVTQTIVLKTPTFDQYQTLYDEYPDKLSCPCSFITSKYQDFLWVDPIFHPICTSNYFHEDWTKYNNSANQPVNFFDFRYHITSIFNFLASYCSLANGTIANALMAFNSTQMISVELFSKNLFQKKTQQAIDAFIQSTTRIFSYDLNSIRTTTQANYMYSGLSINSLGVFEGSYPSLELIIYPIGYSNHSCSTKATATEMAQIYGFNGTSFDAKYMVPGFRLGCYIDEAVRQSTFECLFNQSCIDTLKFHLDFNQSSNTTAPLDPNAINTFNTTSLIDDVISNLMVDQWVSNDTFKIYYEKCQPPSCSYTLITKTPFIVVVATLIGLYGGLTSVLRIIVPFIIKFIRRRRQLLEPPLSFQIRVRTILQKIKNTIQNLNLFRSTYQQDGDDNEYQLKNQLISTRIFIFLLFISMIILLVYTSQVQVTRTITIDSPSSEVYSSLYEKYAEALVCPCTQIAIAQEDFISLAPTFHQICDSDFIDTNWPTGIDASIGTQYVYNRDVRIRGHSAFTVLISICSLSKTNIANALIDFNSTTFISKNLLPEKVLIAQINTSIDSYITLLAYTFVRSFQTIRDTIQGNGLVSATMSNVAFEIVLPKNASVLTPVGLISPRYKLYDQSSCSCHDSATCSEQAYTYTTDFTKTPIYPIPGLVIGCYGFEAMMQSNLMCFFNQTCVDNIRAAMNYTYNFTTKALDPSKLAYFNTNSTIEDIMKKTMVQHWNRHVSYVKYYNQCRPIYCKHTYEHKNDAIYIVTTILALIGGLTSILQLVVPRVVRLARNILRKRQQRRIHINIIT